MNFTGLFRETLMPMRERKPLGSIRKMLLVMKLTVSLLLIISLQVSALAYAQEKITYQAQEVTLGAILKAISKQTSYQYAIPDQYKVVAKKMDVDFKDASVEDVLEIYFRDQPFTYEIVNKIIVIKARAEEIKEFRKTSFENTRGDLGVPKMPVQCVLVVSFAGYVPEQVIYTLGKLLIQACRVSIQVPDMVDNGTVTDGVMVKQPLKNPPAAAEGTTDLF